MLGITQFTFGGSDLDNNAASDLLQIAIPKFENSIQELRKIAEGLKHFPKTNFFNKKISDVLNGMEKEIFNLDKALDLE